MFRQRYVTYVGDIICHTANALRAQRQTGGVGSFLDTLANASRAKLSGSMHSWVHAPQDTV